MTMLRALAALALAASLPLTGCATTDAPAPVSRRDMEAVPVPEAPLPTRETLPAPPPLPQVVRVPGPSPDRFLGAPVADLEAVTGPPALVRREGSTEFRRYDLTTDCRAYVVALPDGGTVLSLETGASVQGLPAPAFEDCTAREGFVGG